MTRAKRIRHNLFCGGLEELMRAAAMAVPLILVSLVGESAAQSPARSFDELQWVVPSGQRVLLVDDRGRSVLGEVTSLGRTEIEISVTRKGRWRLPVGRDLRFTFRQESVRWIRRDDSTLNGKLIGFGAGLAAAIVVARTGSSGAAHAAFLLPALGTAVGRAIDERHRALLYLSPTAPNAIGSILGVSGVGIGRTWRF
jgi:hypothetical protein